MPKMLHTYITGLCVTSIQRLIEILEAGLAARAATQTSQRKEADRKLVDHIIQRLHAAKED